jgi:hypothetical protein
MRYYTPICIRFDWLYGSMLLHDLGKRSPTSTSTSTVTLQLYCLGFIMPPGCEGMHWMHQLRSRVYRVLNCRQVPTSVSPVLCSANQPPPPGYVYWNMCRLLHFVTKHNCNHGKPTDEHAPLGTSSGVQSRMPHALHIAAPQLRSRRTSACIERSYAGS